MENLDKAMFQGVEQTMLLPLWGRYSESVKENGLIMDDTCIEIVEKLGADFSEFQHQQNPASRLAWVTRAWNLDRELGAVLSREKDVTVVCLGCGLDTVFFRVDNGNLRWYDMDLPDVIGARKRLLGDVARCTMIPGSVLEPASYTGIRITGYPVVIAVGLLYYFTGEEVKRIFQNIAGIAAGGTVIAEYCSARGVEMSNRMVLQNCSGARMIWSAENEETLYALHPGIRGVETYPLFRKIQPLLSGEEARMAALSDQFNIMSFALMTLT